VYRAELNKDFTITTLTAIICGDQVKDNAGKFLACSNDTFANPSGERPAAAARPAAIPLPPPAAIPLPQPALGRLDRHLPALCNKATAFGAS
jgi:hypothetical protein